MLSDAVSFWFYSRYFFLVPRYTINHPGFAKNKKHQSFSFKKILLVVLTGLLLITINQIFVSKAIQYTYLTIWSYSEAHPSWVDEIITNNILINTFFFCMIAQISWSKTTTSLPLAITPVKDPETIKPPDSLVIKDGSTSYKVDIASIQFVQVELNCIHIHTINRKHVMYTSLLNFSKNLPPATFIKIHRSTIVNKNYIQQVRNLPSGDAEVILNNGLTLKCSRRYKLNIILSNN